MEVEFLLEFQKNKEGLNGTRKQKLEFYFWVSHLYGPIWELQPYGANYRKIEQDLFHSIFTLLQDGEVRFAFFDGLGS